MSEVERVFGSKGGVTIDHLDGLTVSAEAWWFNLRSSNTEPLLRLNVEAKTEARLNRVHEEVLALLKR